MLREKKGQATAPSPRKKGLAIPEQYPYTLEKLLADDVL
jgi:hypothetical protein